MMGLPSLYTMDQAQAVRSWLATEKTDMRCGLDRLAERVKKSLTRRIFYMLRGFPQNRPNC
jgi:hypothetical protein